MKHNRMLKCQVQAVIGDAHFDVEKNLTEFFSLF